MAYSFLVFLLRSPVLKMLISNPAIPLFYSFLFAFMKFSSENREFAKMLCPVFTYIIGSNYFIFTFAPAKWTRLYFFHIALSFSNSNLIAGTGSQLWLWPNQRPRLPSNFGMALPLRSLALSALCSFFIAYLVSTPEIFLQGPSFVLAREILF